MNQFKQWWDQASSRDQIMLMAGAAFLLVYLLFMAVLGPVKDMRDKEVLRNTAQRASLERVKELAAKVMEQNASASGARQQSSIESIVQRSFGPNNLQVSSMDASGNNGLRLRFDEVPFDNALKWLHEMEVTQGLQIQDLAISPTNNPGMVSVNLRMQQ
ncbi:hypothetical protein TDB9533_01859 [Thalassocella blandensis]|nr:hypothetical protein TDB9533_01859 [Thalassocella blandensis]